MSSDSARSQRQAEARNDFDVQPDSGTSDFDGEIEAVEKVSNLWAKAHLLDHDPMLQTVIHHMQDGVMLIDRDMRVIEINNPALEILGLPPGTRDIMLTRDVDPGLVKDASGRLLSYEDSVQARCMRGERVRNVEHQVMRKDGSVQHLVVHGSPMCNAEGEVELALIVARDITEIKDLQIRAEEMLAETKRQRSSLMFVINHVPAGVILLDAELNVLAANNFYSHYFDSFPNWRLGAPIDQLLPQAEESGVLSLLRRVLETGQAVNVHDFPYAGFRRGITYWRGTAVPVQLRLDEGLMDAIVVMTVDVTDEIRARERLQELAELAERRARELEAEKARLDTIIQSIPVPLLVCDAQRSVVAYNSAATELAATIGFSDWLPERGMASAPPELELTDASGRPLRPEEMPIGRSLRGETCVSVLINCRSGLRLGKTLCLNSAPIRSADDAVAGAVVAAADVTEQIRVQEQITEIYRREHSIAEKLQTCFLPQELPRIDGFELAQRYRAALDEAQVGGDFYDVFRLGNGRYGMVIGDVAGKGLNAAVFTAMTKYMLRAYALEESAPELALARLNEALTACTPSEVFVTLIYGVLDTRDSTFNYGNAGHEHPMFYSYDKATVTMLDVTGRALALMRGSSYSACGLKLAPGDVLMLYTDGITDAGWGAERNRLGHDRTLRMLQEGALSPVSELADSILNNALEFAGGKLADDAALLMVKAVDGE